MDQTRPAAAIVDGRTRWLACEEARVDPTLAPLQRPGRPDERGAFERIQREAEEEAARRRRAIINGEAVEGNYEEVVE